MNIGNTIQNKNPYQGEGSYTIKGEAFKGTSWACVCNPGKYDTGNMLIDKGDAERSFHVIDGGPGPDNENLPGKA